MTPTPRRCWPPDVPVAPAPRAGAGATASLRHVVRHPNRRPLRALVALASTGLLAVGTATASAQSNPVASLVDGFGKKHPTVSILVQRLDPSGPITVASWKPETSFAPASTMKILTSTSALLTVGPDFRFTTRLEAAPGSGAATGTIAGPAYLIGAGDPMLATRAYSRANLDRLGTPLEDLAHSVRANGVKRITGGIVVDETLFDRQRMGPQWKSDYRWECPPLSGIATNQNRADNGSNVSSPAIAAGQRLVAALRASGVAVSGPVRAGRDAPGGEIIGQVRSKPLRRILVFMNHHSDNFTAETLAKDVGAYGAGNGSTTSGTARAEKLLREKGVLHAADDLIDGSGLSHANRVSAATMVGALEAANADAEWGDALIASLPKGGQGTLIHRLKGPVVRNRVHAKTGYINGVASLAGIVTSKSGVRYAFAFLANTPDIGGAHTAMDKAVTMLAAGAADDVAGAP